MDLCRWLSLPRSMASLSPRSAAPTADRQARAAVTCSDGGRPTRRRVRTADPGRRARTAEAQAVAAVGKDGGGSSRRGCGGGRRRCEPLRRRGRTQRGGAAAGTTHPPTFTSLIGHEEASGGGPTTSPPSSVAIRRWSAVLRHPLRCRQRFDDGRRLPDLPSIVGRDSAVGGISPTSPPSFGLDSAASDCSPAMARPQAAPFFPFSTPSGRLATSTAWTAAATAGVLEKKLGIQTALILFGWDLGSWELGSRPSISPASPLFLARGGRPPRRRAMERRSSVRFSPSEIARMEKLAADRKERVLDSSFCQKLAGEFNWSAGRAGSRALQAAQVQEWFLNKFPASTTKPTCLPITSQEKALASEINMSVSEEKATASEGKGAASEEKSAASEEKLLAFDTSISNNEDEVSPDFPIETRDKVPELEVLEFEAKSAKDSAWYDIAIFLAHRRNKSGEVEVRVRFEGFGADEDEWVNVRKSVRQRSIPLESSQCRNIAEGDLVLCFREGNDEALHFDAHVLEIQRKQHDIRGCRCVFLVEYDHDQVQERVSLRRLSRRPKYF